jgi:hypothetical protein
MPLYFTNINFMTAWRQRHSAGPLNGGPACGNPYGSYRIWKYRVGVPAGLAIVVL